MSTTQFLDAVLPQQGKRFVVAIKGELAVPRRLPNTNQAVITTGQQFDAQDFNVFVAIGGFVEATNAKGNPSREAEHAQWHRCLRLDLDVQAPGENKPNKYADKNEAITGLAKFLIATNLPQPLVVDSGGGYHVYWPFDRDITRAEWQPLADRLKSACLLHGMKADPTATADAARILRLPGTHNQKPHLNGAEVVVKSTSWDTVDPAVFDVQLPAVQQLAALGVPVVSPVQPRTQRSELSMPLTPYDIGNVIRECGVMTDMLAKNGQGYDNNQWWLMLNAVQASMHTPEQKRAIGIELSKGWSNHGKAFDIADFDNTFNRATNGHPFRCGTMAGSGEPAMSICKTCPYYGDNLPSVGVLGYNGFQSKRYAPAAAPVQQAAYTNGTAAPVQTPGPFMLMPDGSVRVVDGKLLGDPHFAVDKNKACKLVTKRNGKPTFVPILNGTYTLKELNPYTTALGSFTSVTIGRGKDGDVTLSLTGASRTDPRAMVSALTDASIHTTTAQAADFMAFMNTFLSDLQNIRSTNTCASKCGWEGNDFTLGLTTYRHGGTQEVAKKTIDPILEEYKPAGDRATWDRSFNIVLNSGADRQMMLALGIATPLMEFSGYHAVVINMLSESGTGKSTTADVITSIWGNPESLRLIGKRDTLNAIFKRTSVTGSMPVVIDEVTALQGDAVTELVHGFSGGRDKQRLTQQAHLATVGDYWRCLVFTSSNRSLIDAMLNADSTDTGGTARLFEIQMPNLTVTADTPHNKILLEDIKQNYGWLGAELAAKFANTPVADLRKLVQGKIAEWDKKLGNGQKGRFHSIIGALAEIGAGIGKGLKYNFDVTAVCNEVLRHAGVQQATVTEQRMTADDFIFGYLNDNRNDLLVYKGNQRGFRQQYSTGGCTGEMHMNDDGSRTYVIREKDFRKYVEEKKGEWSTIRKHPSLVTKNRMYLQNSDEPSQMYKCLVIHRAASAMHAHVKPATGGQVNAVDQP